MLLLRKPQKSLRGFEGKTEKRVFSTNTNMVNNYKRKTSEIDSDRLQDVIRAVKEGQLSIRQGAKEASVCRKTFKKYLRNEITSQPCQGRFRTVFSPEQEQELADFCIQMSDKFCGLTKYSITSLAFELAERNGIDHPFDKDQKSTGNEWLRRFLGRHPQLSMRTPERTSLERAQSFNPQNVNKFFDNLEKLVNEFHVRGPRIFNVDETGVSVVPNKSSKIIAKRGIRQVGTMTSGERGCLVTFVACFSITQFIPPMFIFPKTHIYDHLLNEGPAGSIQAVSDSGWINEELFHEWLVHFANHAKPTDLDPVILVRDGHASHLSWKSVEFCQQNFIHLLTLPPHCSHKMQPCDLVLFGPMKGSYSKEVTDWMRKNKTKKLAPCHIPYIIKTPYNKSSTLAMAENGFRKSGIWSSLTIPHGPDRSVFGTQDFRPSENFPPQVSEEMQLQHVDDIINAVATDAEDFVAPTQITLEIISQDNSHYSDSPEFGFVYLDPTASTEVMTQPSVLEPLHVDVSDPGPSHTPRSSFSISPNDIEDEYAANSVPAPQRKRNRKKGESLILTCPVVSKKIKENHDKNMLARKKRADTKTMKKMRKNEQ